MSHQADLIYISVVHKVYVHVMGRAHILYVLSLCRSNLPYDGSVKPKHVAACTLTKYMLLLVINGVYLLTESFALLS
jgi:hypothetical protein